MQTQKQKQMRGSLHCASLRSGDAVFLWVLRLEQQATTNANATAKANTGVPPLRFASVGMTQFFSGVLRLEQQATTNANANATANANAGGLPLRFASVGMTQFFSWVLRLV